ncbi:helix-turn-helix transcriptional regulator [Planobispora siamensis]|uniref:HTH cro/C1-type domain-containing protein n=1 Tax=Planobispora siamensis TaxID=936338 RepID=A0A8J3WPA7_9ACTN|nr:helix-turn-helix transcriptional regulator [Planobispora siamensis]GIH95432.1 hypothetical protein Psi01_60620 [Planobispora siamensis]
MTSLSQRIQEERLYLGYDADDLAQAVGVTAAQVRSWEAGETEPTPEQAQQLCQVLGLPMERLHGADLTIDAETTAILCGHPGPTHDDLYEVARFKEFLAYHLDGPR